MTLTAELPLLSCFHLADAAPNAGAADERQMEEMSEDGTHSSLLAYKASEYCTSNTQLEPLSPADPAETGLPPENPEESFTLYRELNDFEATVNRAKDPWTRGFWSKLLLVQSGKFSDYVTPDSHLTEAGREFLRTTNGSDREIDPDRIPALAQPAPVPAAEAPKAEDAPEQTPAECSPRQAAGYHRQHLRSPSPFPLPSRERVAETPQQAAGNHLIDPDEGCCAAAPAAEDPRITRYKEMLANPGGAEAVAAEFWDAGQLHTISLLMGSDQDAVTRSLAADALHIALTGGHVGLYPAALPLLRQLDASDVSHLRWVAVEITRFARTQQGISNLAYALIIEALTTPDGKGYLPYHAPQIIRSDLRNSRQRWLLGAALAEAVNHPSRSVREAATNLLKELNEVIVRNMRDALRGGQDLYPSIFSVSDEGPLLLAQMIEEEPQLAGYVTTLLSHEEISVREATAIALTLIADKVDITPALPALGTLLYDEDVGAKGSRRERVDRAVVREALEVATRNPATRELAQKILDTPNWRQAMDQKKGPVATPQSAPKAAKGTTDLERWTTELRQTEGPITLAAKVTSEEQLGILARLIAPDQEIELRAKAAHALEIALRTRAAKLFSAALPLLRDLVAGNHACLLTPALNIVRNARREPNVSTRAYLFLFEAMSEADDARAVALGDFSGPSQMSMDARRIVSEDMRDPLQRRLLDAALAEAASHPSARMQRVVTKLITEMNAAIFTELQGTLFYDRYWSSLTSRLDPSGPGRLAAKLANSPDLVYHAVSLLRHDRADVWEATATAFSLIADKVNIAPALPLLGELQHRRTMGVNLDMRAAASNPYREALEAAARNPGTRDAALALLHTRGSSEAHAVANPSAPRGKTRPVDKPLEVPTTYPEIDKSVSDLHSYDRSNRDRAAAALRKLAAANGNAGLYVARKVLGELRTMDAAHMGIAATVLAAAAQNNDIAEPLFFDQLVGCLREASAERQISEALVNWAHRPRSREHVLAAIEKRIAQADDIMRSRLSGVIARLLASTVTHDDAAARLASASQERNPLMRAAVAISLGKAFQAGYRPSSAEEKMLDSLAKDRDGNVRKQAEWAWGLI